MPFKRNSKKRERIRRHTVYDSAEFARQVHAASQLVQTHIEYGPNEVSVDVAVDQRRGSVPGFASTPSSAEPLVKVTATRKIPSKYSECLYLRHGSDMRRCPMPSPITLTTIKHLFINLFDLDPSIADDPTQHLFLLDRSNVWKPLDDITLVGDHCTILLVDAGELGSDTPVSPPSAARSSSGTPDYRTPSPDVPITPRPNDVCKEVHLPNNTDQERAKSVDIALLPSYNPSGDKYDDFNQHRLAQFSPFSAHNISHNANFIHQTYSLCQSIQSLKEDMHMMRQEQQQKMNEFQTYIALVKQKLNMAVQGVSMENAPSFRQERIAIESAKAEYKSSSTTVLSELEVLQTMVENCRIDVVERRCTVEPSEIDAMAERVTSLNVALNQLQGQFGPIQSTLKSVMKQELQVIVAEERFIEQESTKLEEAVENSRTLSETLQALQQFSTVQYHRSPHIPYYLTTEDNNKEALIASINAIHPEHNNRLQSLQRAEMIQEMKRQNSPSRQALRKFESDLQNRQLNLKRTNNFESVEERQKNALSSLYLEEKLQKRREIEREIELARKAVEERRIKEVKEAEERWKKEERELRRQESDKELEIKRLEEERRKLEEQRRMQEEETKRLDDLRKQHEEEQQRLQLEQIRQEEEKQKIIMQKTHQEEEKRKLEQEREQWSEYQKRLASDSPDNRTKRREILWQHVQQQLMQDGRRRVEQSGRNSSSGTRSVTPHEQPGYFKELDWNARPTAVVLPPNTSASLTSSSHHNLYSQLTIPAGGNRSTPSLHPKFSSEDSLVAQNLYDLPWDSKRMLLAKKSGSLGQSGSFEQASPVNSHRRNLSDASSPGLGEHSLLTKPERNADTGELRQTPSPNQLSFSLHAHKIVKTQSLHRSLNGAISPLDEPRLGHSHHRPFSRQYPMSGSTHQDPPSYHQVISSGSNSTLTSYNGMRSPSSDPRHRTLQYPINNSQPLKQKPSVSYV